MPTNLYGPNDNFDLEKSHVLPALIRKIHCAKLLNEGKDNEVVKDLGLNSIDEAKAYLANFGVDKNRVEIWGSGKPMREFLWSEDMADACVFIMENRDFLETYATANRSNTTSSKIEVKNHEVRNTHINIGTGIDISIKDLATSIKEIVGFKGEIYFNTDKPDGTPRKLMDVSKLAKAGWTYSIKLEEGIKAVYKDVLASGKLDS